MADNHVHRPVGRIMDDPALDNYEFLDAINSAFNMPGLVTGPGTRFLLEVITNGEAPVAGARNDRFISHELFLPLQPGALDPLGREHHRARRDATALRREAVEAMMARYEARIVAGPDPDSDDPWDAVFETFQTQLRDRRLYRASDTALANTCLEEPELVASEPPRQCRADVAAQDCYDGPDPDEMREWLEEETDERKRIQEAQVQLDEFFERCNASKREIPGHKSKIQAAADAWCAKDPSAYAEWQKHIINAQKCSKAMSRVWQIALWYHKDVPDDLWDAVHGLAMCYIEIGLDDFHMKEIEVDELGTEGIELPCCEFHKFVHDETWPSAVMTKLDGKIVMFGRDYFTDMPNGFADYQPPGASCVGIAKHLLANLEARKICVAHEEAGATSMALKACLQKFCKKAAKVLDEVELKQFELTGSRNEKLEDALDMTRVIILDCIAELTGVPRSRNDDPRRVRKMAGFEAALAELW